mmetsp:Transcript_56769/g.93935  ORF Transcript_56769/g.93935 Transcript_56769/m.93935 type:complete len:270 (+) Transcript_56769:285-1094(+)
MDVASSNFTMEMVDGTVVRMCNKPTDGTEQLIAALHTYGTCSLSAQKDFLRARPPLSSRSMLGADHHRAARNSPAATKIVHVIGDRRVDNLLMLGDAVGLRVLLCGLRQARKEMVRVRDPACNGDGAINIARVAAAIALLHVEAAARRCPNLRAIPWRHVNAATFWVVREDDWRSTASARYAPTSHATSERRFVEEANPGFVDHVPFVITNAQAWRKGEVRLNVIIVCTQEGALFERLRYEAAVEAARSWGEIHEIALRNQVCTWLHEY